MDDVLAWLLDTVRATPELDDWELADALVARGASELTAKRVVVFTPIAFGRALLDGSGVRFDPGFEVLAETSRTRKPIFASTIVLVL